MTDLTWPCPQCKEQVSFAGSRRFVQCSSCGCHSVILRDEAGRAVLELPGTAISTETSIHLESADELTLQIADAKEEVQLRQAEVDATTTAYWRGRLGLQRVIASSQSATYLSGLLSAVAAFLAVFSQPPAERLFFAAVAVLLGLVGWALHREWRDEERLGQGDLAGSLAAVKEARVAYDATMNRLQDLTCEQSICVAFSTGSTEETSG